ncbi:hypothetical protein IIB50_00355, partial [Patescibacteria group bacterium]|nr:hypothetical protein [Patescibacteria group bacterium]
MFDLKVIHSVLDQLEEERGIPRAKVLEAIEIALATAYKREYGKRGQIIRAVFNNDIGDVEFFQVMKVVDESKVRIEEEVTLEKSPEESSSIKKATKKTESEETPEKDTGEKTQEEDTRVCCDPEKHIFIEDA